MSDAERIVIVGGGAAAGRAAARLRETAWEGNLTVVTAEAHPPYERPPLSKSMLLTGSDPAEAFVRPREWYDDNAVDLRLSERAVAVDPDTRRVRTTTGELPYDRLLLATGARPRRLESALLRGESGATLTYLRDIDDSLRIRSVIEHGARIAILGGGWIGLEVAAAARTWGCEAIVIERGERPLQHVLGPVIAQRFLDLHHEHAATVLTGATVASIDSDDRAARVSLTDDTKIEVDLLVVGIGAAPDVGYAPPEIVSASGGIATDQQLHTRLPGIYAAGDVANAFHPRYGHELRVDHWSNAIHQGEHAADNMLGARRAYDRLPFFYSDQYDLGMEYVGHVRAGTPAELVVRGDLDSDAFVAFWVHDGSVLAGMHVNSWDAMPDIQTIVEATGLDLDPARLGDLTVPLDEFAGV